MEGSKGLGVGSAHALRLTTTITCPSISDSIPEVWKLIQKQSVALEGIERRVQMEARVYSGSVESEFGITEWVKVDNEDKIKVDI